MNWKDAIKRTLNRAPRPRHLTHGERGEKAARQHLRKQGMKFLTANFRSRHGEVDLVFRDGPCLVFAEVKTRSSEDWTRPAAAVNRAKRLRLARTGLDYLRRLGNPPVAFRFDIVEVLLESGRVREIRHIANAFELPAPLRYA